MSSIRSTQINRVRTRAAAIFGPGFNAEWFHTQFDRASVQKLQQLLAPYRVGDGKKYDPYPPCLFLEGSSRMSDLFLNPALIKVGTISYWASIM